MARYKLTLLFIQVLIQFCSCEINNDEKVKLMNGFVKFYNNLPNQIYKSEEAYLLNAHQTDISNAYDIEAVLKVSDIHNVDVTKYIKCSANIADVDITTSTFEAGMVVMSHECHDDPILGEKPGYPDVTSPTLNALNVPEVTESTFIRKPIQLDNEVQTNTAVTSGEQFIAVPREEPKVHCIGCSSHVSPQAEGVNELADIGIRQLNSLEPSVQHSLNSVVEVERQVQVVNGIRYILTLIVDYNRCSTHEANTCLTSAACKVTILEKPWMKLPDKSKYRAILSNNCTREWRFGDDGVVIPKTPSDNREDNTLNPSNPEGNTDDAIKPIHVVNVQSSQQTEKILTDEDIKNIEGQIIPNNEFYSQSTANEYVSSTSKPLGESNDNIAKLDASAQYSSDKIQPSKPHNIVNLEDEKKKTIDDLINFFNFAGLDSNSYNEAASRVKRDRTWILDGNKFELLCDEFNTDIETTAKRSLYAQDGLIEQSPQVPGGLQEKDPNSPEYKQLAEESLQKYLHESGNSQLHKVTKIEKVTVQVVAGTKTIIHFKMSPMTPASGDVISCRSEIWEQKWRNFKQIDVKCHIEDTNSRAKRGGMAGGLVEVDPNSPEYKQLAEESLQKYLQDSGNSQPHKITEIEKVTVQVVAGSKTVIHFKMSPMTPASGDVIRCRSEIWEQKWRNFKQIDVKCHIEDTNSRTKRNGMPGGLVEVDPNSPEYKQLAEESLQKYLQESGNSQPHKITEIEKVTVQVVAGSKTVIHFKMSPMTPASGDVIRCRSEIWEQKWRNFKQIDVKCHIEDTNSRAKRSGMDGGLVEVDPNSPEYKQLAEESLQKYLQESGNSQPHKITEIEKVTVQVVAGSKTVIHFKMSPMTPASGDVIRCRSEIWEQKWRNFKQIDVKCHIEDTNSRAKRGGMAGGLVEVDPNSPEYKQLAEESLQKYLQESGNSQPHKITEIEKVTVQVVAGSKTVIHFKMSPMTPASGDVIRCRSEIWEQKWRNFKQIDVKCHIEDTNSRAKRSGMDGGLVEVDPNSPEYKQLAEESLQKYLQESGNSQPHKITEIEKVTVQVVAGSKTVIHFKMSPMTPASGDVIRCRSEIWEQKWRNFKQIDVKCHIEDTNSRAKRGGMAGGLVEVDPNSPEYKQLAEESLQKYLQESGNSQPHKITEIEKVTVQVVAGSKTVIHFKMSPMTPASGDVIRCRSEIWEQKWRNFKQIDVKCHIEDTNSRAKRSGMDGGLVEVDPNSPEYKQLAEESLQKYLQESGNSQPHKITEIEKVTVQVVAGSKTVIHFKMSPMTPASGDVIRCRSEIWEQKWRNLKQIDVKCHIEDTNSRAKRNGMPGGLVEVDPNSPEYKQLAEESLQKYLQESGNSQPHKITEIEKVTVQVVAGSKTVIHFKMSPMTPASGDVISCRSEIWEQKWRNFKQIDVNCSIDNVRSKRNIIVGGVTEQDTNNPKYMLLAEQSLEKYLSDSGNIESLKVVGIDKVTTQMVAGIKTIIYFNIAPKASNNNVIKCKAVIMEQPWLNITEINVDCKDDKQPKRNKREIKKFHSNDKKSVGAVHEEDPTKFEYKVLAEESLTKYKKRQKNYNSHVVAKVKKVTTQVVAGIRYTIDFVAAPSLCADDVSYCDINKVIDCHAIVRHQSWLEHKDIDISCNIPHRNSKRNTSLRNAKGNQLINNESRQRRSISLDSTNATDVEFQSTPLAQALAERALKHIEAKYPHPRKQKVTRIFSLNKQVVAGVHYRMKIEIGLTNCSALSNQTYCKIDTKGDGANKFCTVNIWLRPLMDNPPNYRVTCDNQEGAMAEMYHHMQAEYLFRDFLTTYMPDYINDHDKISQRFEIFKANVQKIHDLNTHERGTASYGVTRFTDLTYEEFTSKHLGLKPSLRDDNQVPMRKAVIPSGDIPENFDWRDKGAVTEVKNQGSCGSCWAFSVTGNIEGQWKLKSGQLVSLSEQELVDCDTMDSGCNGGMPDNAYRAIEQLGGLETENDYPYEGEDDKCSFNKTLSRVQISGALNISSNETDMAKWLVANGPISIGINANAMQFYMGGVSHPWRMLCSPSNLDHGVLVVGYGVKSYPLFKKRLPYWIIKNSWGPSWGEQGYYRVYRGDGTCGVNQMASSAVV